MEFISVARPRGAEWAKVVKVIVTMSILGCGTEKDPVRYIYQFWDFKGNLLASRDTLEDIKSTQENN